MNKLNMSVLLGLLALASTAQGADPDPGPNAAAGGGFLFQGDFDYGGDDVATVDFDDDSSQDLKAGQGLAISLGGWFRPIESSAFEIQASVGYKFSTTAAS